VNLDLAYFERLERDVAALLAAETRVAEEAVLRSVQLKAAVVSEDEREGGYRQILNFGHTLGHALEAASRYALGHGSAVAAGMVLEAELGERMGVTEVGTRERLAEALRKLLPVSTASIAPHDAMRYLKTDKKVRAGRSRVVLLRRVGETDPGSGWTHEVAEKLIAEVLEQGVGGG
jgi:3-dehydroquinate synthase